MNVNFNENYFEQNSEPIRISSKSIEQFSQSEESEPKAIKFIDQSTQTDELELESKPKPIMFIDQSIQTDELKEIKEINELNEQIQKLTDKNTKQGLHITRMSYDNGKLKENYNELMQLVMLITKLDTDHPDIELIRNKLTLLVNREIRLKYAFPFTTIFNKFKL